MTTLPADPPEATRDEGPVTLTLADGGARFSLRIHPADTAAACDAFGCALPRRIGARAAAADREALCVGPDEWLLTASPAAGETIVQRFAALEARTPHSLTDISDRERVITLSGGGAADLLSVGCPLDLDGLRPGDGTRTVFDGVTVILRRDGPDAFTLEAWRSYLPHVWQVLTRANRELAAGL